MTEQRKREIAFDLHCMLGELSEERERLSMKSCPTWPFMGDIDQDISERNREEKLKIIKERSLKIETTIEKLFNNDQSCFEISEFRKYCLPSPIKKLEIKTGLVTGETFIWFEVKKTREIKKDFKEKIKLLYINEDIKSGGYSFLPRAKSELKRARDYNISIVKMMKEFEKEEKNIPVKKLAA